MSDTPQVDLGEVFLKDVRLSFADIFEAKEFKNDDGTSRFRFGANFLLPKDNSAQAKYQGKTMPALKALKLAKEAKLKEWDAKFDPKKLKPGNHCVRDGDYEKYDGYEDHYYVSANNKDQPVVVDELRKPLSGREGKPYSGCWVNAVVRLWVQKPGERNGNTVPLRVNASLEAVQFWRDGDAFGRKRIDPNDYFEKMDGIELNDEDDGAGEEDDLV